MDIGPPPRLSLACDVPPPVSTFVQPAGLDEAMLSYVTSMQPPFEQLLQAYRQIAGVLVLAVVAKQGTAGHPMLDLADTARQRAADALLSRLPPERGRHHHRHLVLAARALAASIDAARLHLRGAKEEATHGVMAPLRAGYKELQWAASLLPGFETVAFSQGCCAFHGPATPLRSAV